VRWEKGKGCLGLVWQSEEPSTFDLTKLHEAAAKGRAYFESLGPTRQGLSWQEYRQLRNYQTVYVRPLYESERHIIGLVSVDSTQEASFEALRDAIEDEMSQVAITAVESALMEFEAASSDEDTDQ
jgi:hypothetical protein